MTARDLPTSYTAAAQKLPIQLRTSASTRRLQTAKCPSPLSLVDILLRVLPHAVTRFFKFVTSNLLSRLPRRGQDNPTELHSLGRARQEDRHHT